MASLYEAPQHTPSRLTAWAGTIETVATTLFYVGAFVLGAAALLIVAGFLRSDEGRAGVRRRMGQITLAVGLGAAAITLFLAAVLPGTLRGQNSSQPTTPADAGSGFDGGSANGDGFQPPSEAPAPSFGGGGGFFSGGS